MRKRGPSKDGDLKELKRVQKDLKDHLREVKESYRRKIEQKLKTNRMKIITGCISGEGTTIEGGVVRADQLNDFFNRFDHSKPLTCQSPVPPPNLLLSSSPHQLILPLILPLRTTSHHQ